MGILFTTFAISKFKIKSFKNLSLKEFICGRDTGKKINKPQNPNVVFRVGEQSVLEKTASGIPEWLLSTPEVTLSQRTQLLEQ